MLQRFLGTVLFFCLAVCALELPNPQHGLDGVGHLGFSCLPQWPFVCFMLVVVVLLGDHCLLCMFMPKHFGLCVKLFICCFGMFCMYHCSFTSWYYKLSDNFLGGGSSTCWGTGLRVFGSSPLPVVGEGATTPSEHPWVRYWTHKCSHKAPLWWSGDSSIGIPCLIPYVHPPRDPGRN